MDNMQFPSASSPETEVVDKRHVVSRLLGAISELAATSDLEPVGTAAFAQIVLRTEPINPFDWLGKQLERGCGDGESVQTGCQHVYWSDREGKESIAGLGSADEISGDRFDDLDSLRSRLNETAGTDLSLRYFGGLRFDDQADVSAEWRSFGGFRFVLPRIEVHAYGEYSEVRCNIRMPISESDVEALRSEIGAVTFSRTSWERSPMLPVYREDLPDLGGWTRNIEWALDAFSRTRLGKIVLARKATFGFSTSVDSASLLDRLVDATPDCYHFLFSGSDGSTFIGASPERLFKLADREIWSEAVAGSRPRGATEGDDDLLRDELLLSEKEQREHQFVRQNIKDTLAELCDHLEVDGRPSEMKLAKGRHLVSRVRGRVASSVDSLDLLRALHPTPAVGGHPTKDAVSAIAKLEPFDRGWYAAPVGWISADAAEFAVGIRSGLLNGKRLSLYSGAGIVGGSTPDSEWAEIENKIIDFISVFDSETPSQK